MVKVKVLGSSSSGNCYLFESDDTCLVVEAGIRPEEVKAGIGWNVSKICGCIFTHEHKDHSRYVERYLRDGIRCYASKGTIEALGIDSPYLTAIPPFRVFQIAEWKILPFRTEHDCCEPYGYLINNRECGNILFATDTYYLPNTFKDLNHIFIECNYSKEYVDKSDVNDSVKKRLFSSHLSLETCLDALRANNLSKAENIVLIHLSDSNSNAEEFRKTIEEATGIPTMIAEKGSEIHLSIF